LDLSIRPGIVNSISEAERGIIAHYDSNLPDETKTQTARDIRLNNSH
jgi:hypothetical protein